MRKLVGFIQRFFRGDDIVLVKRTKEQWEHQFSAGKWDRLTDNQRNTVEIARIILNYARSSGKRLRVLDVGCGNGGLARLIASEPTIAYTGIDISEAAIGTAREGSPLGRFLATDGERPPAHLGIFDVLVFNEVFFYMNPDRVLPHYRVHAAPDAITIVSVVRSWRTPFIAWRMKRHLLVTTQIQVSEEPHQWDITVGRFL